MSLLAALFLAALALSLLLTPACRALAVRFGFVARPREDRWHRRPTALLGGIAVAVSALSVQIVWGSSGPMLVLILGTAAMFVVGLVDDLITLKPSTKLVAEVAIASVFVFFGYRLAWTESLTLDTLLTMVWIIGLTNAFNLLDNMDGLCAGVGLICGAGILATLALNGLVAPEAMHLAALLGAMAGFFVYNVHPASIFMGDSGSLFIGLNLAVLTLGTPHGSHAPSNVLSIIVGPLMIVLVPIFDTTLVTVSRILSGRSAAQGGRDHSSHRLVAIGLSERRAVAVLWILAALGGLLSLAIRGVQDGWASAVAAIFVLAMIIFAVYLANVRVYEDPDEGVLNSGRITPFVVNFKYRQRVAEILLDLSLASIAYYAAWRLRFEGPAYSMYFPVFLQSLPLVVGIQIVALSAVGGYRGVWQYFGLMDGVAFGKGVFFGTLSSVSLVLFLYRFENYSRGVFVIYAALMMLFLCGSRASFRLISEFAHRRRAGGRPLIIYGAGDLGATAVCDLLNRTAAGYRILGFVDDDPSLARMRVRGYPVLGGYGSLVSLIASGAVDTVVITRLIDGGRLEALQELCAEHHVSLTRFHFRLDPLVAAPSEEDLLLTR